MKTEGKSKQSALGFPAIEPFMSLEAALQASLHLKDMHGKLQGETVTSAEVFPKDSIPCSRDWK